jgi:hypothetical protein
MTAKHSERDSWPLLRWIGKTGLRIDDRIRRRRHVCEFSNDPRCVLRMQVAEARRDIVLADGALVRSGDKLIDIHLWNEHVPVIARDGPTFAWGRRLGMAMDLSFRQLAAFLAHHPELDGVTAIRGTMAVATARSTTPLLRIMQHYGFEIVPDHEPVSWRQALYVRGENILGLLLLLAVNPAVARMSVLSRVRSQVLLSRQAFDRRYGAADRADCNSAGALHRSARG